MWHDGCSIGRVPGPLSGLEPGRRTALFSTFFSTRTTMLPVAAPEVIFKSLPDGAVLFHPVQEVYYGLNTVGEQIWKLLPPASDSVEQICAELGGRYPAVEADVLRRDIEELLADLRANGLVVAGAPADAHASARDRASA